MEETPIIPADASPIVPEAPAEAQLTDLIRRLAQQLDSARQAQDAREEAIEQREASLQKKELCALARQLLREKELPEDLADPLVFADEDAVRQGIGILEKAFRAAVQQGVEDRLQSTAPKSGEIKPLDQLTDEEYYAAVCRSN